MLLWMLNAAGMLGRKSITTLGLLGTSRMALASFAGKAEADAITDLLQLSYHQRGGFNSAHGGMSL